MNRHGMLRWLVCTGALLGLSSILSAQDTPPPAEPAKPADAKPADAKAGPAPRVEFEIALGEESWGKIIIELNNEKAPISTENFLRYVDEGYYDGTIFHRVIPTFMVQGGGYASLTEEKSKGLHEPIKNEARNGLKNQRGTIAMARTNAPHSATAQFFINVVDNAMLDAPGRDGWGYAVFGKVVEGMDVVDRIKGIETRVNPQMPGEKSQPVNPPTIKKAKRADAGAVKPADKPADAPAKDGAKPDEPKDAPAEGGDKHPK